MRRCYVGRRFQPRTLLTIERAVAICEEYAAQGYDLTLRQLYYQFVARGFIPNSQKSYDKLGNTISDARLAGYLDWNFIVDRTRNLRAVPHWATPAKAVERMSERYRNNKWVRQPCYVEVWIEKDALIGVLDAVCPSEDVPYFSCRGYTSQSETWQAGRRIGKQIQAGKKAIILHLGDHDPSGIDMSRDIFDRLQRFISVDLGLDAGLSLANSQATVSLQFEVKRIALSMEQVRTYDPPPNPAKINDPRAGEYIREHGNQSWELDALDPATLAALIRQHIALYRDDAIWAEDKAKERKGRHLLAECSRRWPEVRALLEQEQEEVPVEDQPGSEG